jgi:hypothetical protein
MLATFSRSPTTSVSVLRFILADWPSDYAPDHFATNHFATNDFAMDQGAPGKSLALR